MEYCNLYLNTQMLDIIPININIIVLMDMMIRTPMKHVLQGSINLRKNVFKNYFLPIKNNIRMEFSC